MSELKGLIIPFLLGGSIISSVKFAAIKLNNPALAAILGAIPTGLISVYFLTKKNSISYSENYFYITLILSIIILLFYLLNIHTKLNKNTILFFSLLAWSTLVWLHYWFSNNKKKNN